MAAEEGGIITFIFTGEVGEVIPRNATRFIAHESVTVIPERLFNRHPNIVELICHDGVKRIKNRAFYFCPRLRRLIIPGVEIVEYEAICFCSAVTYVECPKLERIRASAFVNCESLNRINLPSAKIVEYLAFSSCTAATDVKFGKNLESIGRGAFLDCPSLERITIPLKNGWITHGDIFQACVNLKRVDLVEGAVLHETTSALLLEEWRNDMKNEIDSINHILPNTFAGDRILDAGGKGEAIRQWITSVLRKVIHYKAQHRILLEKTASTLSNDLPNDIVMNNVLPFLALQPHTFEGEAQDHEEEEEVYGSNSSDDEY